MLVLPAQESVASTKEKLLNALQARGLKEINGDAIPEDPAGIELGQPIDRNQLQRGWISMDPVPEESDKPGTKKSAKETLQSLNIQNGQAIAFRFKTSLDGDDDDDNGVPEWDVVIPSLDDELA